MPRSDDIQHYLLATWRMMTGKPDAIRMLDLSAEGFWDSFFAIIIAIPALFVSWVTVANDIGGGGTTGDRVSILFGLAFVDLVSWVAPLVVLGLVARYVGIGDRFVHYVVATNWASAIVIWLMVPPGIIQLFWPQAEAFALALSLGLIALTLVLMWRVTNAAIAKGPGVATGVFVGMFALSLVILLTLQPLLGLSHA